MKPATEHTKTHGKEKVLIKSFLCVLCALWLVLPSFAQEPDTLAAARAAFEREPGHRSAAELAAAFLREGKHEEGVIWFSGRLSSGSTAARAAASYGIGEIRYEREELGEAAAAYDAAARGFSRAGKTMDEASAVYYRGMARLYGRRDYAGAIADMERSLRLIENLEGQSPNVAATLAGIGSAYFLKGEAPKALSYQERALAIFERIGDGAKAAAVLHNLASVHWRLGNYGEARSRFERCLALKEKLNDPISLEQTLHNLGNVFWSTGDYKRALEYFERSLSIAREAGDRRSMSMTFTNMGAVYARMGDYERAIAFYEKSLDITVSLGDMDGRASALNNLGVVYYQLGGHERALRHYEESLRIRETLGDMPGMAEALNNIGTLYRDMGEFSKAQNYLERWTRLYGEAGDKAGAAAALHNIGSLYESLGETGKARDAHMESLRLAEAIGHRNHAAQTLAALCLNPSGGPRERAGFGERALALAEGIGDPSRVYEAHEALGALHSAFGNRPDSARHYRAAIDAAEGMRSLLSESGNKSGLLGTKMRAYEGLVEVLLAQQASGQTPAASKTDSSLPGARLLEPGYSSEAFSTAERMRARSFLDEIGAARFAREGVPPELMEKKRLLEARMKWLAERQ